MVRRLPLIALVALLAVALPAAADGESSAEASGSAEPACLAWDLFCVPAVAACDAWMASCSVDLYGVPIVGSEMQTGETMACRVWDLNMPDNDQPIEETFLLDPDGCLRSFVRRTLGWPPTQHGIPAHVSSTATDLLSWP